MKLGIHLIPDNWTTLRARAEVADRTGFSNIWMAESPLSVFDVYITLTVAAQCTRRIVLGPGCTNVVLRHDSLVAAALGSIDELAGGGRVVCAIGSGDTPIRILGERPSRIEEMRRAIARIQALTEGRTAEYHGRGVRLAWAHRRLPVYLAAEGPRTIEMGAEAADGILCGAGISPEVVTWVRDRTAAGAGRAGRDPARVDLWYACMLSIAGSREEARARIRPRIANRARHAIMAAPDLVPEAHQAEGRRLIENFDIAAWYDPKHAGLVTDYMIDRFGVAGTVEEVVDRLRALEAQGVGALMIDLPLGTFEETLRLVGERVIPRLTS